MVSAQKTIALTAWFLSLSTISHQDDVITASSPPALFLCHEPSVAHGWVQSNGLQQFNVGAFIYLHCDDGYRMLMEYFMAYPIKVVCQSDGAWHTSRGGTNMPTCIEKPCGQPPMLPSSSRELLTAGGMRILNPLDTFSPGTQAKYTCVKDFVLDIPAHNKLLCMHGDWQGTRPHCHSTPPPLCSTLPDVPHGQMMLELYGQAYLSPVLVAWVKAHYTCDPGYQLTGTPTRECQDGKWSGSGVSCLPPSTHGCPAPPTIEHGGFSFREEQQDAHGRVAEGTLISYFCHNGYQLADGSDQARQTCRQGLWQGPMPTCIQRTHCEPPSDIAHGNWVVGGKTHVLYGIGTEITYECSDDYQVSGAADLRCQSTGYWSDNPPKCLPKAQQCPKPESVEHGDYMCNAGGCSMQVGVTILYVCSPNYEPMGVVQHVCEDGGIWSAPQPVCLPVSTTTPEPELFAGFNTNTVTVVTATSCSVLGVLVIVILIVAVQRRQPSQSLCHPVPPATPPYPHAGLLDEQDRVALIAFADGCQAVLPTYEEATRQRSRLSSGGSSRRLAPGEYRPLPTIPATLRGRLDNQRAPGVHNTPAADNHRNSIITMASTATRDNLSMAFGSMDTVNISDGTSTTVTIDTVDSAASNPSLALSQRAVAGSIGSSHCSLANDDAPLLDLHSSDAMSNEDKSPEEKPDETDSK